MKLFSLCILLLSITSIKSVAQSESDWLFDDSSLPEIYITIDPTDLALILNNVQSDTEYPANFIFTREGVADTVENIGFRIRGNTSRTSAKKSFKVSFDTFVDGREYRGLDKMNINGEHNDPSIIRSKLSWDVFEALNVIAPRSNHVRLFINDEYFGLYMNVEHIDNEFVEDRFGSDAGNLYKSLYPADLSYLGDDPDDYKREEFGRQIYELKTNEDVNDYTDIAEFIQFMYNASDQVFEKEIRDYINVDGVLRVMAVDILTGMWDDYMFNKNNFYLYHNPATDRFEFIPFDYDNTFGIDWFNIDWDERDINNWGAEESRPLTDRLFGIQRYRDRLNYYINKLMNDHFNSFTMFSEIDRLKAMVQQAAEQDQYRTLDYGFSIEDFNTSFDSPLDVFHVKRGVKEYILNRYNSARDQLVLNDISPVILYADAKLSYTTNGAIITVSAQAFDDNPDLTITAFLNSTEPVSTQMLDNGLNGDQIEGDGKYTAVIALEDPADQIQVYVTVEDNILQMDRFPYNPDNFIEIEIPEYSENLLINEFMASNNSTVQDEFSDFEDWVEIYNPTNSPISLLGYYLTDDLEEPTKWAFPDTIVQSQEFLLVWTDNDVEDGPLHTSFRLSRSGEDLGLFFNQNDTILTIDAFTFSEQVTDVSYGRSPDGNSTFASFTNPSPGESNGNETSIDVEEVEAPSQIQLYQNYPNPFNPNTRISFTLVEPLHVQLNVYSIHGAFIQTLADGMFISGTHNVNFDAGSLASGVYFYTLEAASGEILTRKMTLLK